MAPRIFSGAIGAIVWLSFAGAARAQPVVPPPPPDPPPAAAAAEPAPLAQTLTAGPAPGSVQYGGGLRARWISVPSWFLGLFTKQNVPLSTFGFGGEFVRRKGEMDIVLGIGWQKMGPPDGNWLGKGKMAGIDTDFIQFRNFALIGMDASFLWRTEISPYFGFHYGAGLGIAIVTGEMLRISAAGCTEQNVGDRAQCKPRFCPPEGCTEAMLKASEGSVDNGPGDPHRFRDSNVPGAVPILNMLMGLDFRIPETKGLEFRLQGGFYNAFFIGLTTAYVY